MHDAANLRRVKRYQKFLFGLISLVYIIPFIQGVIMSVVAKDIMRDLNLSPDRMGLLGSSYMWVYAVSMTLSGMAAAYFGPRRYVAAMYFISGVGGLVSAYADGIGLAVAGRVMAGIGTAFFSLGGVGAFLGAAPMALVNAARGWRSCMLIVGWTTIVFAGLVFLFVRDWPPAGSEKELGLSAAPRNPASLPLMWDAVKILSRSADFWKLVMWLFSMSGIYLSFAGLWAVPYFKDAHHLNDSRAGLALSLFAFGCVFGTPFLTWLTEKKLHSNRIGLASASLLALVSYLVMLIAGDRLGYAGLSAACLAIGLAHNGPNAISHASARNLFGSRLAGIASGLLSGLCFVSGGVLQIVAGNVLELAHRRGIADDVAYPLAFIPYIALSLLAVYCAISLSRGSDPGRISPMSWRAVLKRDDHQ